MWTSLEYLVLHAAAFVSGIVTIPASVYQSVTSMGHVVQDHTGANTIHVAMAPGFLKTEVPDATQAVEVTSIDAHVVGHS